MGSGIIYQLGTVFCVGRQTERSPLSPRTRDVRTAACMMTKPRHLLMSGLCHVRLWYGLWPLPVRSEPEGSPLLGAAAGDSTRGTPPDSTVEGWAIREAHIVKMFDVACHGGQDQTARKEAPVPTGSSGRNGGLFAWITWLGAAGQRRSAAAKPRARLLRRCQRADAARGAMGEQDKADGDRNQPAEYEADGRGTARVPRESATQGEAAGAAYPSAYPGAGSLLGGFVVRAPVGDVVPGGGEQLLDGPVEVYRGGGGALLGAGAHGVSPRAGRDTAVARYDGSWAPRCERGAQPVFSELSRSGGLGCLPRGARTAAYALRGCSPSGADVRELWADMLWFRNDDVVVVGGRSCLLRSSRWRLAPSDVVTGREPPTTTGPEPETTQDARHSPRPPAHSPRYSPRWPATHDENSPRQGGHSPRPVVSAVAWSPGRAAGLLPRV
ncbi:hypothetical protein SMICM17S_06366 [Streptomyces microflavus]